MDIFFYNLLFWGCFHISALQTEKENLYINKQKSKWENAKQSCGDNKLAGGEEMKSCQPHNCDFTQLQTIHGLRDDRDILWLDGYLLRSPLLQYEDCYKGEWKFLKTNITTRTTFVENSVYECSYYCMVEGKAISGRYMYLQNINCYCVSEEDHEFWIDQNFTSLSADCKVKCPGRRIDRCGGNETNENTVVGFYSVYRFKLEDVNVTGIQEVGQLCPSINNKGNVMYSNCRDKLLFNCQKMIASAALNVRVNNKCNNMASSWYDAESTCSIQGGHINTTVKTFCNGTNFVENTANWHGSVIIEKIIWNTYIIPTRGVQRSLDYVNSIPTDAKCLALSVRKNHEFRLLALDCSESYYQLCIYGNALLYVSLTVPRSIVYKRDTLQFSCNSTSTVSSSFISDIILWENSDSGWQQIVKISRDRSSGNITEKTVWSNKDVQNRSYITKSCISPNNLAGLQFVISADSVQYTDEGEYRCSIQGSVAPDLKLDKISATKFVEITGSLFRPDQEEFETTGIIIGGIIAGLIIVMVIVIVLCIRRRRGVNVKLPDNPNQQCVHYSTGEYADTEQNNIKSNYTDVDGTCLNNIPNDINDDIYNHLGDVVHNQTTSGGATGNIYGHVGQSEDEYDTTTISNRIDTFDTKDNLYDHTRTMDIDIYDKTDSKLD